MLVTDLRDLLGTRLVAYLSGVKETARADGRWPANMTYSGCNLRTRLERPFDPRRQPVVIQA